MWFFGGVGEYILNFRFFPLIFLHLSLSLSLSLSHVFSSNQTSIHVFWIWQSQLMMMKAVNWIPRQYCLEDQIKPTIE